MATHAMRQAQQPRVVKKAATVETAMNMGPSAHDADAYSDDTMMGSQPPEGDSILAMSIGGSTPRASSSDEDANAETGQPGVHQDVLAHGGEAAHRSMRETHRWP